MFQQEMNTNGQCIVRKYVLFEFMVDGVIMELLGWLQCKMNDHSW